jgi:hypothetical protein
MKKSELKLLQEKLQKVSQPPPPSKKRDDLSDELSKMFDDGTVLESEKRGTTALDTSNETPATQATPTTQGSQGTVGSPGQFLPYVPTAETTQGSQGLSVDSAATSGGPKTSFKTNTNDDDEAQALSDHNSIFSEATKKLTGRAPHASEREQWAELARVLVEELNDAASRAESVSSVPAFFAAHLRRKLALKPVARKREGSQKPDVGAPSMPPPGRDTKLTPEEIKSFTATVVDLLAEGKSVEEVEGAYAPSMHPADWAVVKSVALAQGATKKGK